MRLSEKRRRTTLPGKEVWQSALLGQDTLSRASFNSRPARHRMHARRAQAQDFPYDRTKRLPDSECSCAIIIIISSSGELLVLNILLLYTTCTTCKFKDSRSLEMVMNKEVSQALAMPFPGKGDSEKLGLQQSTNYRGLGNDAFRPYQALPFLD